MAKNIWTDDVYTNKARKEGYVARSIYKLEQIDQKYHLFGPDVKTVLDIWCAPGSWLQYISKKIPSPQILQEGEVIGFDLKKVEINLPGVYTYEQDITDIEWVQKVLDEHEIEKFDVIVSDMAPDTIGKADIDAIRSVGLIEKTLRLYEKYLAPWGKFAIKVFMWPGFDEFVREMKNIYWASNIVVYKPKACRKASKETYVMKRG